MDVDFPNRPAEVVTGLCLKSSVIGDVDDDDDGCPKTVLGPVDDGENIPVVAGVGDTAAVAAAVAITAAAAASAAPVVDELPVNDCSRPSLFAGTGDESNDPSVEVDVVVTVGLGSGADTIVDEGTAVPVAIDGLLIKENEKDVDDVDAVARVVAAMVTATGAVVVTGDLKSVPEAVEDEEGSVKSPAAGDDDDAAAVEDDWKRPLDGMALDPKPAVRLDVGALNIN